MATNCIDKILCENAWECDITILDAEGNPVDPLTLNDGDTVIFQLGEKPGYNFRGWVNENGVPYYFDTVGENRYKFTNINCSNKYIARYCAIQYQIAQTSSSPCFTPSVSYAQYGDIIHIQADDTLSCRFLNWAKDGVLYTEENAFDYVVTGNATFVANYDDIQYRIVAKPNYRNRGTCQGSGLYELSQTAVIIANPCPGYGFDGWNDGSTDIVHEVIVRGNKTYTAYFTVRQNTVEVPSVIGGTVIGRGSYNTGETVSLQAVPEPGWVFSHWQVGQTDYYTPTYSFISENDVTVVPYFEQATYTISFASTPNGTGTFTQQYPATYHYGDTITVEAIPGYGYRFERWQDGFSSPRRDITVTGDAQYVAVFSAVLLSHKMTVILPDDTYFCAIYSGYENIGNVDDNTVEAWATEGTNLRLSPVIPDGKELVSVTDGNGNVIWSHTAETVPPITIPYTMDDTDVELTFNFADVMYEVSLSATPLNEDTSGNIQLTATVGSSSTSFSPTIAIPETNITNVVYGTHASLTAPQTVDDYEFSYWYTTNGSFMTNTVNMTIYGNTRCVAVYRNSSVDSSDD